MANGENTLGICCKCGFAHASGYCYPIRRTIKKDKIKSMNSYPILVIKPFKDYVDKRHH